MSDLFKTMEYIDPWGGPLSRDVAQEIMEYIAESWDYPSNGQMFFDMEVDEDMQESAPNFHAIMREHGKDRINFYYWW